MNTNSWSFPNMFDVARNRVSVMQDTKSIANRVKLLMLTEPTELYMNPTYGLGLRRYLFQYNTDNVVSIIKDKLIEQLRIWEPCVNADATTVERGLHYTGNSKDNEAADLNKLNLTVTLQTVYGDQLSVNITGDDFKGYSI